MRLLLKSSIATMALLCALSSCNRDMVYYSYQHVGNGWRGSDTLFFYLSMNDSMKPLTTETEVRFCEDYPYRELTITATHNLMDSTKFVTDTIHIDMTEPDGTRKGSNWSCLYQASERLKVMRPPHTGNFTIKIAPLMTEGDTIINGINDIGMKIVSLRDKE